MFELKIGLLILLWFIFRGIQSSQEAKKRSNVRQKKNRQLPPKPEVSKQESTRKMVRYEPPVKTEVSSKEDNKVTVPSISIKKVKEKQSKPLRKVSNNINLDKKAVINGLIWSEILGPPKAKRR